MKYTQNVIPDMVRRYDPNHKLRLSFRSWGPLGSREGRNAWSRRQQQIDAFLLRKVMNRSGQFYAVLATGQSGFIEDSHVIIWQ